MSRLPRGGVDVHSWGVEQTADLDGFMLVDEYCEPVDDRVFTGYNAAMKALHEVIIEELAAREEHGPNTEEFVANY
jgi:hypothetical protein